MNYLSIYFLKILRKGYQKIISNKADDKPVCDQNPDSASQNIYDALISDKPCMIARFGSNELNCVVNYLAIKKGEKSVFSYIKGESFQWWWNLGIIKNLHIAAGFFPPKEECLNRFSELMLNDIPEVDILGSWLPQETIFKVELDKCIKVNLELLNPYFSQNPWTRALEGKKILVVHPFAKTIEQQYKKRKMLFENDLLPEFELKTIKAVLSLADEKTEFADWFEALESMKTEIDQQDYDICLIGCGAYGFPIAAHVKRMGKKGFHLGGSLQLLFGIRGKRWENINYNPIYNYAQLMNIYWIKPIEEEKPIGAAKVEGGTYW